MVEVAVVAATKMCNVVFAVVVVVIETRATADDIVSVEVAVVPVAVVVTV